jgi:trimeric autotransporter adhesin
MPTHAVRPRLLLIALLTLPLTLAAQSTTPLSISLAGLYTVDAAVDASTASFPGVQLDSSGNIYLLLDENDGVRLLKLNPSGINILASAHIGAAGDHGIALALSANEIYVTGIAGSGTLSASSGAAEAFPTAQSSFLAGFSSSLSPLFLTSTGGSLASATSLTVVNGSAYVAGSIRGTDLPITGNAAIFSFPAASTTTGFVEAFTASGSALTYATYLGGANGNTFPAAIAADTAGNIYVTGSNTATGFPTINALQPEMIGTADLFLTQLSPANGLEFSTLLGTANGTVAGSALALSSSGTLYLGVNATALGLPISSALVNVPIATNYALVVTIPVSRNSITASTLLGDGFINALTLDSTGNIWAAGVINHIGAWSLTNDLQHVGTGFVTELDAQADLLFSTRLGAITTYASATPQAANNLTGIAVAPNGSVAVSGSWSLLTAAANLLPGALDLPYVNAPSAALPGTIPATIASNVCENTVPACTAGYVAELSPTITSSVAVSADTLPNLTVRNVGQSSLTFTGISATGYVSATDCVTTSPIASGSACNVLLTGNGPGLLTLSVAGGSTIFPLTGAALSTAQYSVAIQPDESAFPVGASALPLVVSNLKTQSQRFQPSSSESSQFNLYAGSVGTACVPNGSGVYTLAANSTCTLEAAFRNASLVSANDGPVQGFVTIQTSGQPINAEQFDAYSLEEADTSSGGSGLMVSTITLDFGTQYIGGLTMPRTVVVSNVSHAAIALDFVSTPPADPNFQVSDLCPVTLPALASCVVAINYSSPVTSTDAASLTLPNGATLQLTGQTLQTPGVGGLSVNPSVSASPATLSFGAVGIGNSTSAQAVTVSNSGSNSVGINLGTSVNFTQTNNCNGVVPASGVCTVEVSFAPSALGVLFGQLAVTPSGSTPVNVALSGGGVSSVAFGPIAFGTQTTQWISLGPVIGGVTATVQGPFQVAAVNGYQYTAPATVTFAASSTTTCTQNCYVGVRAIPTAAGPQNGTLTITPQNGSTVSYPITAGSLYQPSVILNNYSYNYGSVPLHSSSAFTLFTLTNPGLASVSISSLAVSAGFTLDSSCGATLAGGASCILGVAFAPAIPGVISGQLTIAAGASTLSAQLTGNAAADPANITFSPATVLFYSPSSAASQSVTLTNLSSQPRIISAIVPGLGSFFTESSTCTTLAPNATCTITFSASSIASGTDVTAPVTLSINVGGVLYPYTLSVSALPTGFGAGSPSLQVTPAALTFGSTGIGDASNPETLTVTNNSTTTQNILVTAPAGFSVDNTSCLTLASAATCTMPVRFLPYSAGQTSANISIQAIGGPVTIAASGFGIATTALAAPAYPPLLQPISLTSNPQGDGTTQLMQITNRGPQNLLLNGIAATNTIVANACPATLGAGASCALTLETSPTIGCGDACDPYTQPTTITLLTNAASSPDTYTVVQNVQPSDTSTAYPGFLTTTTSLTFPQTALGKSSTQSFKIESTGGASLPVALSITGDFTESGNCNASVAAWQAGSYPFCTVTVSFKPSSAGFRAGSLLLITGAGTQTVTLGGNGPAPSSATPTVTTLQSSANNFTAGETAALTATVTPASGSAVPAGSVTFSVGSTILATVALQNGIARFSASTAGLSSGVYPVSAQYAGTTSFAASLAPTLDVTINAGSTSSTSTTLTASPKLVSVGSSVTLSATVHPSLANGTPTGSVTFLIGSTNLGSASLASGVATLTISTAGFATGSYSILATYSGDGSNAPSTSAPAVVTVSSGATTQTVLSTSPSAPTQGQNVSLIAAVTEVSGSTIPTGTVSYFYGSLLIGAAGLNASGIATFTASSSGLPAGAYVISAQYSGDSANLASTSPNLSVHLRASTTVLLSASPASVPAGQNVSLSASVHQTSGSGTPTGSVTFLVDGNSIGSSALASGTAAYIVSTTGLPAGTYSITAAYSGDSSNGPATSKAVTVTVQ